MSIRREDGCGRLPCCLPYFVLAISEVDAGCTVLTRCSSRGYNSTMSTCKNTCCLIVYVEENVRELFFGYVMRLGVTLRTNTSPGIIPY